MTAGPGAAIGLALAATTSYNAGLLVQKRALRRVPALSLGHAMSLLRALLATPAWLAGFAFMLCGFGLQVLALDLAPVSVVQPLLVSGLVILVVAARVGLRERLSRTETWCVLAMLAGLAAIGASDVGAAGRVGHHAAGLPLAAVAVAACLTAAGLVALTMRGARAGRPARAEIICYGLAAGLCYGVGALAIKGLSGVLAGSGLAGSGFIVPRLAVAAAGSPYPYLVLACSAAGMLVFQTGLQRGRLSIIGPVSTMTGSVFFVIAGTWLFGERLPADPVRLALRITGLVVAAVVTIGLSLASRPTAPAADRAAGGREPEGTDGAESGLERALIAILVCPIDKRPLLYYPDEAVLYNPRLRRVYRFAGDCPVLLAGVAESVGEEEHDRLLTRAGGGAAVATGGAAVETLLAVPSPGNGSGDMIPTDQYYSAKSPLLP